MSKTYRINRKAVAVTAESMRIAPSPGDERDECVMIRDADGTLRPYEPPSALGGVSFRELSVSDGPSEPDRVLH